MSDLREQIEEIIHDVTTKCGCDPIAADECANRILELPAISQMQEQLRAAYSEGYEDAQEAHAMGD